MCLFQIHLWRHLNKYIPPVNAINDGRGRKGEGSYQKSWLELQKWICRKCHPPPITKVLNFNERNRFILQMVHDIWLELTATGVSAK